MEIERPSQLAFGIGGVATFLVAFWGTFVMEVAAVGGFFFFSGLFLLTYVGSRLSPYVLKIEDGMLRYKPAPLSSEQAVETSKIDSFEVEEGGFFQGKEDVWILTGGDERMKILSAKIPEEERMRVRHRLDQIAR